MFWRRRNYAALDARIRELTAQFEIRDAELRALTEAIARLDLPPGVPLRRPPEEALVAIREQAERAMRGEVADRRSGPGRRSSDYH